MQTLYEVEITWTSGDLTILYHPRLNNARRAAKRLSMMPDATTVAVAYEGGGVINIYGRGKVLKEVAEAA